MDLGTGSNGARLDRRRGERQDAMKVNRGDGEGQTSGPIANANLLGVLLPGESGEWGRATDLAWFGGVRDARGFGRREGGRFLKRGSGEGLSWKRFSTPIRATRVAVPEEGLGKKNLGSVSRKSRMANSAYSKSSPRILGSKGRSSGSNKALGSASESCEERREVRRGVGLLGLPACSGVRKENS